MLGSSRPFYMHMYIHTVKSRIFHTHTPAQNVNFLCIENLRKDYPKSKYFMQFTSFMLVILGECVVGGYQTNQSRQNTLLLGCTATAYLDCILINATCTCTCTCMHTCTCMRIL